MYGDLFFDYFLLPALYHDVDSVNRVLYFAFCYVLNSQMLLFTEQVLPPDCV